MTPDALRRSADILGIRLPPAANEANYLQWMRHLDLLYEWNEKVNLTAIRDPQRGLERHLLESLVGASELSPPGEASDRPCIVDVGSGNGYPGLPLLVASAASRGLLIEAAQRKVDFLRAACRKLDVADRVSVVHERVTSISRIAELASGPVVLVFRGIPEPARWLREAASSSAVDRCLAWLSTDDASSVAAELDHSGRKIRIAPLPTQESGSLLVLG